MRKQGMACKVCGTYFETLTELRNHNKGLKNNPCYVPLREFRNPDYIPPVVLKGEIYIAVGPEAWGRAGDQTLAIKRMRFNVPPRYKKGYPYKVYRAHPDTRLNEATGALQYPTGHPPVLVYETSKDLQLVRAVVNKKLNALSLKLYDRPFGELNADQQVELREELQDVS